MCKIVWHSEQKKMHCQTSMHGFIKHYEYFLLVCTLPLNFWHFSNTINYTIMACVSVLND